MNDLNIEFLTDEWFDHQRRKVVWFKAIMDEKTIDCGVSIDALRDHYGGYTDDPLPVFRAHRTEIEAAATKLIAQRRFEDDGTIMIKSSDF
jgi:hypothetical protein